MIERLMVLLPYVPNPPHGGGEQRLHHILNGLLAVVPVEVLALPRLNDVLEPWPLAERLASPPKFFARDPSRNEESSPLQFGIATRQTWPKVVQNSHSPELWNDLDRADLSSLNALHVESFGLIPYGLALKARWPNLRVSLGVDNIDPLYAWRQLKKSGLGSNPRETYWGMRNVMRLVKFSRRWFPAFDSVWTCSETDARWVREWTLQKNVVVVPNGIDCQSFTHLTPATAEPNLVMTGNMSDGPNSDGADWFVRRIWPRIRSKISGASLELVGRDPSDQVKALSAHNGVSVTGPVPDVRPHLIRAAVSIAPLRFGTGTRLKILEAMAAGLPVVSTTVGAEGLDFTPGRDLVLADRPSAFADACIRMLTDSAHRFAIAAAGRSAVQKYDWGTIYATIRQLVQPPREVPA